MVKQPLQTLEGAMGISEKAASGGSGVCVCVVVQWIKTHT